MNDFNFFTNFLLLFGGLCPFTYCVDNDHVYKFVQTEFVKKTWWDPSSDIVLMGARFTEDDKPAEMCAAAKELVSIPSENFQNRNPFTDFKVVPTRAGFVGRDDVSSPFEVIWCNVTPPIWIRRVGTTGEELSLLLKFLPFLYDRDYSFDVEYMESDPTPCLKEDKGNKVWLVWNICETASNRVPEQKPAVMQTSDTTIQLLQFEYIGGNKEKHIAVVCPSHPPMYVYHGNEEGKVKIMVKRTI